MKFQHFSVFQENRNAFPFLLKNVQREIMYFSYLTERIIFEKKAKLSKNSVIGRKVAVLCY